MTKRTRHAPDTYYAQHREEVLAKAKHRRASTQRAAAGDPPNRCPLCGEKKERMVLDHDHDTGRVRGWVCYGCNILLGRLDRDPGWYEKALKHVA